MQDPVKTDSALATFDELSHELLTFMEGVRSWFVTHPSLSNSTSPVVHSVKSRIKDREHLRAKINRKSSAENEIDGSNLATKVTDLTGVRVLHLHQEQLRTIHIEILKKIDIKKDWVLTERPKAYTWDPEASRFFQNLGLDVHLRETSYTSVHYVIRPRNDSPLCCEIQVRTLFEEIWGEVDHALNYPIASPSIALREQLLVLAKVVGAGSRLVDSIYRTKAAEMPPTEPATQEAPPAPQQAQELVPPPITVAVPASLALGLAPGTGTSTIADPD